MTEMTTAKFVPLTTPPLISYSKSMRKQSFSLALAPSAATNGPDPRSPQRPRGFTLIELLVVIAIIGILAAFVVVSLSGAQGKARDAQRKNDVKQIATALEQYKSDSQGAAYYPTDTTLQVLVTKGYMKKVPTDPKTGTDYTYQPVPDAVSPTSYRLYASLEGCDAATIQPCIAATPNYSATSPDLTVVAYSGGTGGTSTPSPTGSGSPTPTPKATGGTITQSGGYTIHTFTTSGTFTANVALNAQVLVVAGGGGGAWGNTASVAGGGGGGGGFVTNNAVAVSTGSYTVTTGTGGIGGVGRGSTATNGGNSSFGSLVTTTGGGGGGEWNNNAASAVGSNGGSGGGGGTAGAGGTATAGQGFAGGSGGQSSHDSGGGGGGAGGAGESRSNGGASVGGAGGAGLASSISGSSVTYAGGGGGVGDSGGAGGNGGGGAQGVAGTANTGGGGGGGSNVSSDGKNGGSGIVIIRYLTL